jgi:hypothetical protein
MYEPIVHPFIDLETTERSRWIAAFCDRAQDPPRGVPLAFPLLPRGESPLSWLEDQYRRAEVTGRRPSCFRESVVDLVRRELAGIELRNHAQTLGVLVDLASACGFTEIAPKLQDWVRGDHYADAVYRVDGHEIALRQTLWSTLIAWGSSAEMVPYLKRDLGRPELGCGALCFSALGRLSPFDAIAEIPSTYAWPTPYWDEVLRDFFENFTGAARTLVDPRLLPAWRSCLGALVWDPVTSERFKPHWGQFRKLLADAGLELSELYGEDKFNLRPKERPTSGLQIDLHTYANDADKQLVAYYQSLFEGASTSSIGMQAFNL